MAGHRRLSVAECLKRAEQCRDYARQVKEPKHGAALAKHGAALESIAETWERIAAEVRQSQYELLRLAVPKNKSNPQNIH